MMDIADTVDAEFDTNAFCKYNDFKQIIPVDYAMPRRKSLLAGGPAVASKQMLDSFLCSSLPPGKDDG